MKITVGRLKNLITEAGRSDERYVSEDEAKEIISNADGDAVSKQDIIDEDTGEIYISAGDSFNKSPWNSDYVAPKRGPKRGPIVDEPEDEEPEEDWFEADRIRRKGLEDAYRAAVKEFAEQFTSFQEESPDITPEDAASDVAENFFHEYPEWRDWATALQMSRTAMKEAITDYVYDAMMKGSD